MHEKLKKEGKRKLRERLKKKNGNKTKKLYKTVEKKRYVGLFGKKWRSGKEVDSKKGE